MALTKFTKDMAIISALDDEPNDVGGLSAAELKEKFDEGGQALKTFINETLLSEIDGTIATKEELSQVVAGISPDLTATEAVLSQI